jgi:hypothetical protein
MNKKKYGFGRVLFTVALAVVFCGTVWLSVAACTSGQPVVSGGRSSGELVWVEASLYLTAPETLNSGQKMALQNYAMAIPAFMAGLDYSAQGIQTTLQGAAEVPLRGALLREVFHRDGLGIWRLEAQVGLPAASRDAVVIQTVTIEAASNDPELAPKADNSAYPANRLVVVLANRAVREASRSGHPSGSIRLAMLQYDSQTGRFRAKFEIL